MEETVESSEAMTRGIRIRVESRYRDEHSNPQQGQYLFSYEVVIENLGEETVQLLTRRWVITDGEGRRQVVEGPGVVGQTPVLAPGACHVYESFCPLPTLLGMMEGSYGMVTEDGVSFDAEIAPFTLSAGTETVN